LKNGKNELIMTKNEENQNDGFIALCNKNGSKCFLFYWLDNLQYNPIS